MNSRLYKNGKGERSASDHRRANPRSGTSRQRVRDSKKFKTVEREHDPLRRFGSCIKVNYIDSDGDGHKDLITRQTRLTSVGSSKYPAPSAPVGDPPAVGPTGISADILQFNIAPISTDQHVLVATTPAAGTIRYSSDREALFIFDGTDWHHFRSDG